MYTEQISLFDYGGAKREASLEGASVKANKSPFKGCEKTTRSEPERMLLTWVNINRMLSKAKFKRRLKVGDLIEDVMAPFIAEAVKSCLHYPKACKATCKVFNEKGECSMLLQIMQDHRGPEFGQKVKETLPPLPIDHVPVSTNILAVDGIVLN